jgi:hypothetical protein
MGISQKMTMRVTIERQGNYTDPYGGKSNLWTTLHSEIPCFVWESENRMNYQTHIVESGTPYMVLHKGTDITVDDKIVSVLDRKGNQLFGKIGIESVVKLKECVKLRLKKIA